MAWLGKAALAGVLGLAPLACGGQILGTGQPANFKDTSMLKPPAGKPVALVVFEDLGCPACAHFHPYEIEAIRKTHVPWLRYDFPIPAHIWTFQAAVNARYLQTKVSPQMADQYRTDVFASQQTISSKEDLEGYTTRWFQTHGQTLPFVIDPSGALAKAVQADFDLGMKMGLKFTPTIVVVMPDRFQVISGTVQESSDPAGIEPVIEAALTQARSAPQRGHAAAH